MVSMVEVSLLITLLREMFGKEELQREPEPMEMNDSNQVIAFSEGGRIDGVMSAAYLFHTARISQVIQGCSTVIDLGCGPATQLAQIAGLNPETQFIGIDLSEEMLNGAKKHVQDLGLDNIEFRIGDITNLPGIPSDFADGVISTMALHHLPTNNSLRCCFSETDRILSRNGAVYITDFSRLKLLKSVIYFAYKNRENQPYLFSLDYERSLRAAFSYQDLKGNAQEILPCHIEVFSTFKVPILTVCKSQDKQLSEEFLRKLDNLRSQLPRQYKKDLDNLRLFFRLGGLKNDPF